MVESEYDKIALICTTIVTMSGSRSSYRVVGVWSWGVVEADSHVWGSDVKWCILRHIENID